MKQQDMYELEKGMAVIVSFQDQEGRRGYGTTIHVLCKIVVIIIRVVLGLMKRIEALENKDVI